VLVGLVAGEESHHDDNYVHGGNNSMKTLLMRLWKEEEGQDLTEYGLLVVFIALALIAGMKVLASGLATMFSNASTSLS
jgi:pilus assembly protein Flp/PilA